MPTKEEKQFTKRLAKAGWYTYLDEESGRVVTNAYPRELAKLSALSGLELEVVKSPADSLDMVCVRVSPRAA